MQSITIPSEADIKAIDLDSLVWDDLMDGTLQESMGAAIKAVLDEISETDIVINLSEQNAATGKTAKFILDNCANAANWKIVSTDMFQDTFLTTSDYFDNVGHATNVYKNDVSGSTEVEFDEAGNAIMFRQLDIHNDNAVVREVDLTVSPELLGVNDLVNEQTPQVPCTHIVNSAGDSLAAEGIYSPDVEIVFTWLVSNGFPVAEANGGRLSLIRAFKRLPTNGILIIPFFGHPVVNESFWDVSQALQLTGSPHEAEYRLNTEADNSGYWQLGIIKKL